jgi:hypothetical protein
MHFLSVVVNYSEMNAINSSTFSYLMHSVSQSFSHGLKQE